MTRHFIFKYYAWIALVMGLSGIACVYLFTNKAETTIISVIIGTLGFCYFVQRQRLAETALFKDLFTEFNARYDLLNDHLSEILVSDDALSAKQRQTVVDYFNLCAEEYLFYKQGFIVPEVWQSWCNGMLMYMDNETVQRLWQHEQGSNSYYGLSLEKIHKGARLRG